MAGKVEIMTGNQAVTVDRAARWALPIIAMLTLGLGTWAVDRVVQSVDDSSRQIRALKDETVSELRAIQKQIGDMTTEQGRVDERLKYHGQRLDGLDNRQAEQERRIEDIEKRIGFERNVYEINSW